MLLLFCAFLFYVGQLAEDCLALLAFRLKLGFSLLLF